MGIVVKLLSAACFSIALRAITTRIPHHPSVVAVQSGNRVDFSCACGRCIHSSSISLRELRSYLTPDPYATFCLHLSIHLSTTQLQGNTHFHSAGYIHSVFPQAFFHAFPMVFFLFSATCLPQKNQSPRQSRK